MTPKITNRMKIGTMIMNRITSIIVPKTSPIIPIIGPAEPNMAVKNPTLNRMSKIIAKRAGLRGCGCGRAHGGTPCH
jgi:hypothetical protein